MTKYLGPTNFRGSRVKAACDAGSVTIEWDPALNGEQNHTQAARALMRKLNWTGKLAGGGTGRGYVFVFV